MSSSDDSSEDPYECAECTETFSSPQKYASHANSSGHDVTGAAETESADAEMSESETEDTAARGLTAALSRLRFARDPDDDGAIEIKRRVLYSQLLVLAVGTVVGHTLAHDPSRAYQVITAAAAAVFGGRAVASVKFSPIPPELFDSKAFTQLGVGMLFGAALVVLPWSRLLEILSGMLA